MCGRYFINTEDELTQIREILKEISIRISNENIKDLNNLGSDAYPGSIAPIITSEKKIISARWGFDKWDNKGLIFNARSESLLDSRFFSPLVPDGRCIVPARSYYEWQKIDKKSKDKYSIFDKASTPLFMAGLSKEDESNGASFVVITRPAAKQIEFIHDRMPLLLTKKEVVSWLAPEFNQALLKANGIEVSYNLQNEGKYVQQSFLDFMS